MRHSRQAAIQSTEFQSGKRMPKGGKQGVNGLRPNQEKRFPRALQNPEKSKQPNGNDESPQDLPAIRRARNKCVSKPGDDRGDRPLPGSCSVSCRERDRQAAGLSHLPPRANVAEWRHLGTSPLGDLFNPHRIGQRSAKIPSCVALDKQ